MYFKTKFAQKMYYFSLFEFLSIIKKHQLYAPNVYIYHLNNA